MIDEVKQFLSKCARFRKVDLHLHSPLSRDWKNNSTKYYQANTNLNRLSHINEISDDKLRDFVALLIDKELDVVAITDHMRYSFGLRLANYVQKQKINIIVYPGIELNVKIKQPLIQDFRIHVLAIFPPNIGNRIDRIFPVSIKDEATRDGSEEVEYDKIGDLVQSVRNIGGICIAAHIYSNNGVRYGYTKSAELVLEPLEAGQQKERDEFYEKVGDAVKSELFKFDCLQVNSATEPIHFLNASGELSVPLVLASDAHHPEFIGSDEKLSFIKMGRLDFECLKEAFKFPDTRIRFRSNLPECKPPRLRGVRIVGKHNNRRAFFKKMVVGFSDNLTCVIGPRGSGKSALIDAIRYAIGYNRTLDEIEKLKDQVINRQRNTLEESSIELLYEKKDGGSHRIHSTYDSRELYNSKVFDLENNKLNIPDIEKCGDYPLNLYGWNELELLGENPKTQRENLDKFIKELIILKQEKSELCRQLSENRKECLSQLDILDNYFNIQPGQHSFLRLREFEKQFESLNTPEIKEKFKTLDEITQKMNFLDQLKVALDTTLTSISKLTMIDYQTILNNFKNITGWCNDFLEKRLEPKKLNDALLKSKGGFEGDINSVKLIIEEEEKVLQESKNETSKVIRGAIGEEEAISIDLRETAKKRFDSSNAEFESYKRDLEKLESLLSARKVIINKVKDVNKKIFATRNEEIAKIEGKIGIVNDQEFKISLKLNQACDRTDFLNALEENRYALIFHGHWKNKKIPNVLTAKFTSFSFVDAFYANNPKELVHKITISDNNMFVEYSIDSDYAQKFFADNLPFEELKELQVKKYDKDKLLRLLCVEEIPFDDEFYIELGGKPIQFCSPGQRCSAMLPIVTLTSDAPIIIDQPEDNLDNRLVSRAIFKILARLKESRQIIVATHNPNIPVSGDAEQVIVLNHDGTIKDHGSIDEPSIIKNIIELMEGGKEAFGKRQKKYVNHLS